jgi:hypothetical protein
MNMKRMYLIALTAAISTLALNAQDKPAEGQGQRRGNPLIAALDANHDGEIDATEINNAPAALRKLDKNGDGKLTRQELRAGARGDAANADGGKRGKKKKNQ